MRVLVTGEAGFLVSHLCDALLAAGHSVVCADNLLTGRRENLKQLAHEPCLEFMEQHVCKAFDPGGVDYIFHFASAASPADYLKHAIETLRASSTGTMNYLELAKKHKAKFLLVSTSDIMETRWSVLRRRLTGDM
jgi:dTDP-glucose 4,6-dehydratase